MIVKKNKIEYVVGFMFSSDFKKVALIEKTKPNWQKGKLNGIGGKVEKDEFPLDAMVREFKEEAGIKYDYWNKFCTINSINSIVYFYYAVCSKNKFSEIKTIEEEKVIKCCVNEIPKNIITNINWLIPMAISMSKDLADEFMITEIYNEK